MMSQGARDVGINGVRDDLDVPTAIPSSVPSDAAADRRHNAPGAAAAASSDRRSIAAPSDGHAAAVVEAAEHGLPTTTVEQAADAIGTSKSQIHVNFEKLYGFAQAHAEAHLRDLDAQEKALAAHYIQQAVAAQRQAVLQQLQQLRQQQQAQALADQYHVSAEQPNAEAQTPAAAQLRDIAAQQQALAAQRQAVLQQLEELRQHQQAQASAAQNHDGADLSDDEMGHITMDQSELDHVAITSAICQFTSQLSRGPQSPLSDDEIGMARIEDSATVVNRALERLKALAAQAGASGLTDAQVKAIGDALRKMLQNDPVYCLQVSEALTASEAAASEVAASEVAAAEVATPNGK